MIKIVMMNDDVYCFSEGTFTHYEQYDEGFIIYNDEVTVGWFRCSEIMTFIYVEKGTKIEEI